MYEALKASGHVDEFTDLTVDCKKCKQSYKVEEIIEDNLNVEDAVKKGIVKCPTCGDTLDDAYPVNLMFSTKIGLGNARDAFLRPETAQGIFTNFHLLYRYAREKLPFGVIQVGSRQPGHFSQDNKDVLELIGNRIGIAIENAILQDQCVKSEEKYRTLFNSDPHPIFILDSRTFNILDVNQRA